MESQVWKVQTEKIGTLEAFRSERDMESFLMNNPAVLGCWDPGAKIPRPTLLQQQIQLKIDGDIGRIDLMGVGCTEGGYELRIFELKVGNITAEDVDQLDWYLKAWKEDDKARRSIKDAVLRLKLEGINEQSVDDFLNIPIGVMVGPKFLPDAILKASELGIRGIRLARFKAEKRSEYYVIVEDQIGDVMIKHFWSWNDLIDAGLINKPDDFSISYGEIKLTAKVHPRYLDYYWKYLIYDEESKQKLLENETEIRKNAELAEWKWIDKDLKSLKKGKELVITHASALFYFSFGGPYPTCYWTPIGWWKHEKSGKSLEQLKSELPG